MLTTRVIRFACLLFVSVACTSVANAALISPSDGSTITSSPAAFNWSAGARAFWLRAYNDSTNVKIYDSGRINASTLNTSVSIPASVTNLRVIFYELSGGSWIPMESTYTVDLGTTPPSAGLLPDGNAPGDRLVWDGDSWEPEQPVEEVFPPDDNMMPFQNIAFIIKIQGPAPATSGSGGPPADTPFVGQIIMWAGTYPPKGWAFADGQIVVVTDFPELFAVIGNNYGDVSEGLFKLPDLRGRVPVHFGNGPGLSNRLIGDTGGYEAVHNLDTSE